MKIRIKTPSRLHLGLIDLNGNLGRLYGSIGVAVSRPNTLVEAIPAKKLEIRGREKERVAGYVARFSEHYGIEPRVRINVPEAIPAHNGLGSGTQLALSVGTALAKVHGIKAPLRETASVMRRGLVSGIGFTAYQKGGFIVDTGFDSLKKKPAQPLFHKPFHRDWVFVVAVPSGGRRFSGINEANAFREIIPGPEKIAKEISRIVLMKLLPSFLEKDITLFGSALTEIDGKTGEYYKKIPHDKTSEEILECMIALGAYGGGQSSWGPAVYGLTEKKSAWRLEAGMRRLLKEKGLDGPVYTAEPDNKGAVVEIQ
ncbi:MAG: hypothetical protein JW724_01495 [Candidatus Altiarchaeota archaeon]|nr:hypothetical protein [Candidatus Altiarchaeota archaeon]